MAKVLIKNERFRDLDNKIRLNNGNLRNGFVLGTYIVTSFRNNKGSDRWENTAPYCSLINFADGNIKFSEPSSRSTTERRLLSHLTNGMNTNFNFNEHSICVYANEAYGIEITLSGKVEMA
jgi:hypothetical protein